MIALIVGGHMPQERIPTLGPDGKLLEKFLPEVPDANLPARLETVSPTVADCNTVVSNGFYRIVNGDTLNGPGPGWFALFVYVYNETSVYQQASELTGATGTPAMYERHSYTDGWSAWRRIRRTEAELDARYLNHSEVIGDGNLPERLRAQSGKVVTDWNNATQNGYYRDFGGSTLNSPVAGQVYMGHVVVADEPNGYLIQTLWNVFVDRASNNEVWRRYRAGLDFSPWFRVYETQGELDARYASAQRAGGSLVNSDMARVTQNADPLAMPVGWRNESNGGGSAISEPSTLLGAGGRHMVIHGKPGGNGVATSDPFPVSPGAKYKLSADLWYAANVPNAYLRLIWLNGSQGFLGYTDAWAAFPASFLPGASGTNAPSRIISAERDAPTNAAYAQMQIISADNSAGDSYLVVANPRADRVEGVEVPDRLSGNTDGTAQHLNTFGNDWNNAVRTGWYMSDGAANSPQNGVWFIGTVVAHNSLWVTQEVWNFTAAGPSNQRFRRHRNNGTWGTWEKVIDTSQGQVYKSAQVVSDANLATDSGWHYVTNTTTNMPVPWWGILDVRSVSGEVHQVYRGFGFVTSRSNGSEARTWQRWRNGSGTWGAWSEMTVDRLDQEYLYGNFGNAFARPIANPDSAVKPGSYDWQGGSATSPNMVFALAADYGANLIVTSYQDIWVKQTARIWDTDQTWVRFRHGALNIWGEWVPVHTHKAIDSARQRMAHKGGSGRNLVYNGRFDYVSDPTNQVPRSLDRLRYNVPGWRAPYAIADGANGGQWLFGGNVSSGGLSLGLRASDNTSVMYVHSDPFPITPGKTYRWKFRVWSDSAIPQGIFMGFEMRRNCKEYEGFLDQLVSDVSLVANVGHVGGTFTTYEGYYTIPAGDSLYGVLRPHAWTGSNPTGTNTIYYTDIEFEEVIPSAALGDSAWTNITLINGWTNYDPANWQNPQYRKIGNRVTLRGMANGTAATSIILGTLPTGFRPAASRITPVSHAPGGAGEFRVLSDGTLIYQTGGTPGWVSLEAITFLID